MPTFKLQLLPERSLKFIGPELHSGPYGVPRLTACEEAAIEALETPHYASLCYYP
jgi:hypothetical protein